MYCFRVGVGSDYHVYRFPVGGGIVITMCTVFLLELVVITMCTVFLLELVVITMCTVFLLELSLIHI